MKKKKHKKSVAEKILELENFLKVPKTAEDIKKELKDSMGYSIDMYAIRMALIRLLRSKKIKRKKEGKIYKYNI